MDLVALFGWKTHHVTSKTMSYVAIHLDTYSWLCFAKEPETERKFEAELFCFDMLLTNIFYFKNTFSVA